MRVELGRTWSFHSVNSNLSVPSTASLSILSLNKIQAFVHVLRSKSHSKSSASRFLNTTEFNSQAHHKYARIECLASLDNYQLRNVNPESVHCRRFSTSEWVLDMRYNLCLVRLGTKRHRSSFSTCQTHGFSEFSCWASSDFCRILDKALILSAFACTPCPRISDSWQSCGGGGASGNTFGISTCLGGSSNAGTPPPPQGSTLCYVHPPVSRPAPLFSKWLSANQSALMQTKLRTHQVFF